MRFARLRLLAALTLLALSAPALSEEPLEVVSEAEGRQLVPMGRLDKATVPQRYRLDLTVDPSHERFSGHVEIDIMLARTTRRIDLHGRSLDLRRVVVLSQGNPLVPSRVLAHPSGVLRLEFDSRLPAGPATLAFDYEASFNDSPSGLFRVNVDGDWYSWSQFESVDARAAFPSFDQPDFKTPFELTLRTPPGLMAVSNAPELSVSREDGLDVHRFAPTLPLPTYLVAMMVGPFAALESEVAPNQYRPKALPLRIVSTRPNAGQLAFALEGSKQIVALLEGYFGEAFPFPKLDQITSPIMPGAMENAGADLYADRLLVLDANASPSRQRAFGMVVSHELAHQWFGDLATPAWWDDIWLNESFANWMGYRIGDAWRGDLNIGSGALAAGFGAMQLDSLIAGRPVRQPIAMTSGIDAAFDPITYGKGGHVIAMFASYMGDDTFRQGVRRYLAAHRYQSATSEDFFAALGEAAGNASIVPAFRSFVEQQGVPLVSFRRLGRDFELVQSRYAPIGVTAPDTRWIVPVCLRRSKERTCKMLSEETGTIPFGSAGPIVPNAGGAGYYRFELPRDLWRKLIESARSLPGGEAQAVADSLAASVLAGRSDVSDLVRLARKLARHKDTTAADSAAGLLDALIDSGIVGPAGKKDWERISGNIHAPLLARFGFDPRARAYNLEPSERTQRRAQVVSRLLWTPAGSDLRMRLKSAGDAFLAGDASALDPAWYGPAFDLNVRLAGEKAARDLLEKALASEDVSFRPDAISAVGSSGDAALAKWLLEDFKDVRLRKSEELVLLRGVMSRSSTRDYGYDWILANLDELLNGKGGIFVSARLPQLFSGFCSLEQAQQLSSALRPRFAGTSGALELERTIERVRNCGLAKQSIGSAIAASLARIK